MAAKTYVYLITGFLGSGKTTFLNRIIAAFPRDRTLMVLMNEFGEIGVDGTLIQGDNIELLEISKGSIFCVCVKTDFIKGLYELSTKLQPDVLFIESTGVANPSDLKKDLKLPIYSNRFQFMEQFCMVDAAYFLEAYEAYASLEKQIASSTVFIINKIDLASPERIEKIKGVIRNFHPEPAFYETTYGKTPLEKSFSLGHPPAQEDLALPVEAGKTSVLSDEDLDVFIGDMLNSPDLEITPPDRLISVTYQWSGQDLREVEALAESLPRAVIRAKGFLKERGGIYLFNYVMGDWSIEKSELSVERVKHKNVIVFIAPPESMEGIDRAAKADTWVKMGAYQPFSDPEEESATQGMEGQ